MKLVFNNYMAETKDKGISWVVFLGGLSLVLTIFGILTTYTFNRMGQIEQKQVYQDTANTEIKTQLSQIQTDIAWIKLNLTKYDK